MDHICQIARQNTLYSRGTQHKACGPNVALQRFENACNGLLNAVNAFQGELKHLQQQLSTDNMLQFKSILSYE